ncbi:putative protease 2 [Cocos nucifera]|uniref:Prolyl endopeptidase n=1 Tax=Cocos nucifera TaxID=13894 RepID=A0A8K0HVJ4_COCNU|nr:putative protease 2 [Cocos nucifera]
MLRRRGLFPSSPLPIFSSLFSSFSSSCCYSSCKRTVPSLRPPVPKKIPFATSAHGRNWEDPYRWMSNTDDPDLLDHLNRENAYAEAFMADTRDLQRRLVAEMKGRMPRTLSTPPERWGPWVFSTKLGSDEADDLLFTENDASCCVDITSTKDGKFITVNSNSRTSSEEDKAPTSSTTIVCSTVQPRSFPVINTNAIVLPGEGITFQDMDIFHGHLVLFLYQKGIPLFCSVNLPVDVNIKNGTAPGTDTWYRTASCTDALYQGCKHVGMQAIKVEDLNPWFFPAPSSLCSVLPGSNHDFKSSTYRVVISSLVMPDIMVDYNMEKQTFRSIHQEESHSNQHLQNVEDSHKWNDLSESFCCERREVISYDGVLVPLTILYSRQAKNTGQSPGLLHGYGAYGEVLDKSWCSDHISLLSRGWVLAYADVRGGGGDASWHQAGTRSCKLNSIKDFAACGMYLVKEGFVHKNRLCAIGCSAGGLLVGATINLYPDLFCAAILKVPFLDICNTMLDRSLPLTILDYDEFGDPRNQDDYEMIRSYSPYDNISPRVCYPSVLVTTSFHDSRVGVWEAAKWVAKVRDNTCPTCSRSVILKTNMSGGHFAEGGRFIHCDDAAFEYAFLIKAMGLLQDEKQA